MGFILEGCAEAVTLLASGDEQTYSAVWTTVRTTTASLAASVAIGAPLGFCLAHYDFPGKGGVRLAVDTLLSLPTVVIGLLAYAMFTARGPLGGMGLLFTVPGMAAAQTVLALPIVVALTANGVQALDQRLTPTLKTLGASPLALARTTIYEARHALLLAAATAYGRVVSEVGISMMIGGNIKWHTRTVTTAIALETGKGEFARGIALGAVLMAVALAVNLLLRAVRRRQP